MRVRSLLTVSAMLSLGSFAVADTITFDSLSHGEIVNTQFLPTEGVEISAVNPNRPFDLAIIFDTTLTGTADPDLEGPPWAVGNLPLDTVFGNALIIAENNIDVDPPDGLIDSPDDEGHRPAGEFIFDYVSPISEFGFDVLDVEGIPEAFTISFYLEETLVGEVGLADLLDSDSDFYDPTLVFGNNSANRIQPFTAPGLGAPAFDRVVLGMGGSGAVDNVVPEPGSIMLLAVGLLYASRRAGGRA